MDRRFVYLDHPADAKFQAFGDTLEEAFGNSALAVASLMWDIGTIRKASSQLIVAEGLDLQQLLVKFLGEIPYLLETKKFLLASVEDVHIEERNGRFYLNGILWGDERPEGYPVFGEVKAITYNQMEIKKNGRWTVQVVVDV